MYSLKQVQTFPISIDEAWNFFSHPKNLESITPDKVKFIILSSAEEISEMYEGLIIKYKISPFANIYFNWVTEITHVKEKEFFVDEQRFGPYLFWHHKHFFTPIDGGVEMTDFLHYKIPFGFLGKIAHKLFLKKQIDEIFKFRAKKLEELLGKKTTKSVC